MASEFLVMKSSHVPAVSVRKMFTKYMRFFYTYLKSFGNEDCNKHDNKRGFFIFFREIHIKKFVDSSVLG